MSGKNILNLMKISGLQIGEAQQNSNKVIVRHAMVNLLKNKEKFWKQQEKNRYSHTKEQWKDKQLTSKIMESRRPWNYEKNVSTKHYISSKINFQIWNWSKGYSQIYKDLENPFLADIDYPKYKRKSFKLKGSDTRE